MCWRGGSFEPRLSNGGGQIVPQMSEMRSVRIRVFKQVFSAVDGQ